jgi:hypothetical protein
MKELSVFARKEFLAAGKPELAYEDFISRRRGIDEAIANLQESQHLLDEQARRAASHVLHSICSELPNTPEECIGLCTLSILVDGVNLEPFNANEDSKHRYIISDDQSASNSAISLALVGMSGFAFNQRRWLHVAVGTVQELVAVHNSISHALYAYTIQTGSASRLAARITYVSSPVDGDDCVTTHTVAVCSRRDQTTGTFKRTSWCSHGVEDSDNHMRDECFVYDDYLAELEQVSTAVSRPAHDTYQRFLCAVDADVALLSSKYHA